MSGAALSKRPIGSSPFKLDSTMPKTSQQAMEAFRSALDPETLATIDALRELISAADTRLEEELKWNAPNFKLGTKHRVTLGLERKGGSRVVLNRGTPKKHNKG